MGNVGKARVEISLSDALPEVNPDPGYASFDICSGFMREISVNSSKNIPNYIDFESLEQTFTVAFLEKGLHRINNYVNGDKQWSLPKTARNVVWTPTDDRSTSTVMKCYFDSADDKMYKLMQPSDDYASNTSYDGPRWWTRPDSVGSKKDPLLVDADDSVPGDESTTLYSTSIEQYQVTPGLWWGIKTSPQLPKQTGMWLTVKFGGERKVEKSSFLGVVINPSGVAPDGSSGSGTSDAGKGAVTSPDGFSIVVDEQGCYLVDHFHPYDSTLTEAPNDLKDWNRFALKGAGSISGTGAIQIGILPMMGYLVVYVNGQSNIYARRDSIDPTTYARFTMAINEVRVYGRNSSVEMDMSAMVFAPKGSLSPPIVNSGKGSAWEGSKTGPHSSIIGGSGTSLAVFPGPNGTVSCGACCSSFIGGGGGGTSPSGEANDGNIHKMCPADSAYGTIEISFTGDGPNGLQTMKINFEVQLLKCFNGTIDLPIGTPYLFRLRGNLVNSTQQSAGGGFGSTDVISMSESWDSPDYVHLVRTVDITLYNPFGKYNSLLRKSMGITVVADIGGNPQKIFTGITLDASSSEVAGKETLTIHCKDYMELLEMNMFLNCPYYDGMLDITAAKDIAARAGVRVESDTGFVGQMGYFLPAGYSFQEPKMKWSSDTTLKDGLLNVLKLGEKICYFDQDGVMRISNLQGGLAFSGIGVSSAASFTRDPGGTDYNVVLDEKREDHLVGSSVSRVFVTSWDRNAGGVILYQDANPNPNVPYAKTLYYDQPAFGSVAAVVEWVNMIKERVFKVPRRITFKTIQRDFSLRPLDFIDVDGQQYRVKAVNRRFDADSNSITTEINGEWFGP